MSDSYRVTATQKTTASLIKLEDHSTVSAFFPRKFKPICGDRVTIEQAKGEHKIKSIDKRCNSFCRADNRGRKQHIAANVDQIMIVMAVKPAPTRDILNRYLVTAELEGIEPILVFNKSDMDDQVFINLINQYEQLGYQVFKTSKKEAASITAIKPLLADKTTVIVGQSGVGKSSITRVMMPTVELKTGKLSAKTGKGAHTTSVTQMYHYEPLNAFIIDSPGVWEYGLWLMTPHEIAHGFREFQTLLGQCKFSNCTHIHEPQCAIMAAVKAGRIRDSRYQSYLRIVDSMKYWG
ncbi:ribosome small subunit-dependent GTPase A [Marinicella meishanensis]|uniref:ribosome small subunit-dependent GTPase A n=1 Tax=Marinicella meishanensis TaxID=2873263 RepID=UPI001CBE67A7|nr:ribosome small subunit-dependent GTPase A [Marinicella sp. NBU2979]